MKVSAQPANQAPALAQEKQNEVIFDRQFRQPKEAEKHVEILHFRVGTQSRTMCKSKQHQKRAHNQLRTASKTQKKGPLPIAEATRLFRRDCCHLEAGALFEKPLNLN